MKKIHLLLLGLTICLFSACHNDIWDAIDGLDSRVTKLEELCKEMNTNITSLQTIVSVLQSNDYITGIVEIKKNGEVIGYTITFGTHEPITIYNGEDGSSIAPIIGVAQDTDGIYYWTLNGEWLLDEDGNKLPVTGDDAQNGTMPQLKIEEGYWYVSYDSGATWTQLGKATGEDGKDGADGKDGQDGDSMFQSVTQDENYVYFTLADGTVIKISKGNNESTENEYEYVDLGLSVKWATKNIGAECPGDIGRLCISPNSIAGGEDIAITELGGTWRTPTISEIQELIDHCSVTLDHVVNSSGKIVYGIIFSKNNNSIFLPLENHQLYPSSYEFLTAHGYYWSSNVNLTDDQIIGRALRVDVQIREWNDDIYRNIERTLIDLDINRLCPIRPVCE